ncbi:hypothetical protein EYF80_002052 [Liparis tanakae]|uniref:Uncharacterized protein n=1 Tax=Liparis tanakae TaxID=230148 RepID=A0A4Z2JBL1_9TELE|nr:hypothetical protein EYF80_002052 [Liparis tanakae]
MYNSLRSSMGSMMKSSSLVEICIRQSKTPRHRAMDTMAAEHSGFLIGCQVSLYAAAPVNNALTQLVDSYGIRGGAQPPFT